MGRFWGPSWALALAASLVLAAGLLSACNLNPQPSPPAKGRGGDNGGPVATAATGSATTGAMAEPSATSGAPIVDNASGGGGSVDPDPPPESVDGEHPSDGAGAQGGGGGGAGGAAGAAGMPEDESPPPPANGPR